MHDDARDSQAFQNPSHWSLAALGLLALGVFVLHFPGHATYDTLAQAYDGATRIYTSNQPPAMSLLLSVLTLPGMLALQIILFSAAVWRLLILSGGTAPAQLCVLVALFLYPVLLMYTGIVWKDVLFAHGAVLAVLLLPANALHTRWPALAVSAAILAVAVSVRQQAAIVAVVAVLYLLCADGIAGLKHRARWLALCVWIAIFSLCSMGIKTTVQASGDTGALAYVGPIRQIAMFDLGGILARVPDLEFPAIEARAGEAPIEHRPSRDRVVKQLGRYSPERQDFMVEPDTEIPMWIPPEAWLADWGASIRQHPLAYVAHRLDATSWLLGFHGPEKCVPFAVGISSEPGHMLAALGAEPGMSSRAEWLEKFGWSWRSLFQPWIYIGLSLATTACLMARGVREHGPVIALQTCGLLYAASYFVIGFACDFRYTYFTTISALFGAAYLAGVIARPRLKQHSGG